MEYKNTQHLQEMDLKCFMLKLGYKLYYFRKSFENVHVSHSMAPALSYNTAVMLYNTCTSWLFDDTLQVKYPFTKEVFAEARYERVFSRIYLQGCKNGEIKCTKHQLRFNYDQV
jgi:hypothetical protein